MCLRGAEGLLMPARISNTKERVVKERHLRKPSWERKRATRAGLKENQIDWVVREP